MKERIIISTYDDITNPYYHGGGAVSVHELAKRLATDYQVTVVTSRHKVSASDGVIDGVHYTRVGYTPDFFPQLGQLIFQGCLPFVAMRLNFDLWLESFTPPFSTSFLPLWTGKPVIGVVHFLSGKEMRQRYKLPFDILEKIGLQMYHHFIVPNETSRREVALIQPDATIICIPNGITLPPRRRTKQKKYVTFLGRIEVQQKGLDLLIQAIALLKNPDWTYVIAGSGIAREMRHLNDLIVKYQVMDHVKVVGRVEGRAKQTLLEETAIMVVPSRYETFSLTALEAMANSLPLVTFAIEGLSWLPSRGGLKAKCFEPRSLAKQIHTLQANHEKQKTMGLVNRTSAEKYAWDHVVRQYKSALVGII